MNKKEKRIAKSAAGRRLGNVTLFRLAHLSINGLERGRNDPLMKSVDGTKLEDAIDTH